jgi:hypothetical protein
MHKGGGEAQWACPERDLYARLVDTFQPEHDTASDDELVMSTLTAHPDDDELRAVLTAQFLTPFRDEEPSSAFSHPSPLPRPIARSPLTWGFAPGKSSLGAAKSSLGDAKSLLGDAKSSLGDDESSLGDGDSSLGDAKSSLGDVQAAATWRVSNHARSWLTAQGRGQAPRAWQRTTPTPTAASTRTPRTPRTQRQ